MRINYYVLIFFFLFIVSVSSVSAVAPLGFDGVFRGFVSFFESFITETEPLFRAILGDYNTSSEYFIGKILITIILISLIYVITSKIDLLDDHGKVKWIISIGVGILGVRFWTEEMVKTVILPYNIVGIALTSFLPLGLFFIFVYQSGFSAPVRKVAWGFLAMAFLMIYVVRYDEILTYGWIYLLAAVVAVVVMLFDGTIQNWRIRSRSRRARASVNSVRLIHLQHQRDQIASITNTASYHGAVAGGGLGNIGPNAYNADLMELERQINEIIANST